MEKVLLIELSIKGKAQKHKYLIKLEMKNKKDLEKLLLYKNEWR